MEPTTGRTDKAALDDGKWAVIKFFRLNFELIFVRPQAQATQAAVAGKSKAKGQQKEREEMGEKEGAAHLISCAG